MFDAVERVQLVEVVGLAAFLLVGVVGVALGTWSFLSVFVELPDVGDEIAAGEAFGVVESIKAVSDLYAPVSGEVVAINEELFDRPELVNEDPYGDGWLLDVDPVEGGDAEGLLDPDEYGDQIA